MLDDYGLEREDRQAQDARLQLARDGYEAACLRRGSEPDWESLGADERYMWFMTADAMMRYRQERDQAIAC